MADTFYNEFVNAQMGAPTHSVVDLNGDTIKVALRDEGTTAVNISTQVDLADVSSAHVGTAVTVSSPTVGSVAAGRFDHALATFSSVSGASCESIDYFKDSGSAATSPLIANIDSATGLPVTPNGGDITWNPAAGGAFGFNVA